MIILRHLQTIRHNAFMQITHTDATFTMTSKHWSGTYPLDELPKWLAFYRRQRADFPKSGRVYDAAVTGLEALALALRANTGDDVTISSGTCQ